MAQVAAERDNALIRTDGETLPFGWLRTVRRRADTEQTDNWTG